MMRWTAAQIVAEVGSVTHERLTVMVENGWVSPAIGPEGPAFDVLDKARIRLLCQLSDDLELDDETMPVVLSLLDQLYGLRRELKAIGTAIDRQPESVKADIRSAYKAFLDE
ncbi:chaperone modulator CbpM [Acuticoccus kandeliae]|uniref:chaperone modulator CbpM n=1 Tax=Acuticoccus kandeliae TaxID=2073160 RepID=UPI00196A2464|nr:chaperone modulator CbpM [Acuticoccus kandeliae]